MIFGTNNNIASQINQMNFNLYVLDKNMESVAVIDKFQSFIWTERYNSYGDFELVVPATKDTIAIFQNDFMLSRDADSLPMIIDRCENSTDVDDGDLITVKGRSLSFLLDRRIVWTQTRITGNLQNGIEKLLNDNVINPSDAKRKMPMTFRKSSDKRITDLAVDAQFTGDSLYDAIESICSANSLGFRVGADPETKSYWFELYLGEDHSYTQKDTSNPYVIFSPSFDNLINSNFITSNRSYRTVALVGGEGEGSERKFEQVTQDDKNASGIYRHELFVNASDITSRQQDNSVLPDAQYRSLLKQRGMEKLKEKATTTAFEGQVETAKSFKYGSDFSIGDIIEVEDHYGHSTTSRVIEYIYSVDDSGVKTYPTFEGLEKGISDE